MFHHHMKKLSKMTEHHGGGRGARFHAMDGSMSAEAGSGEQSAPEMGRHGSHGHGGRGRGEGKMMGRHHGGEKSEHGRSRRERIFGQGDLRLLVLDELSRKDGYGYELIKAIGERVGDDYMPSPGIIYPTLMYLEEAGLLQIDAANTSKKVYQITDAGKTFLSEHQEELTQIAARLEHRKNRGDAGKVPELHRAISNIKLVLNLKIDSQTLDETKLKQIVKILDQAASDINQL